jgi:hypothetical protein
MENSDDEKIANETLPPGDTDATGHSKGTPRSFKGSAGIALHATLSAQQIPLICLSDDDVMVGEDDARKLVAPIDRHNVLSSGRNNGCGPGHTVGHHASENRRIVPLGQAHFEVDRDATRSMNQSDDSDVRSVPQHSGHDGKLAQQGVDRESHAYTVRDASIEQVEASDHAAHYTINNNARKRVPLDALMSSRVNRKRPVSSSPLPVGSVHILDLDAPSHGVSSVDVDSGTKTKSQILQRDEGVDEQEMAGRAGGMDEDEMKTEDKVFMLEGFSLFSL